MDPCPFVRLIIESLSLKIPTTKKPTNNSSEIYPSSTSAHYAKLKLKKFPTQITQIALTPPNTDTTPDNSSSSSTNFFHLDPTSLRRLLSKNPILPLKVSIFTGRAGRTCGVTCGKLVGSVRLSLNLAGAEQKGCVYHKGWVKVDDVAVLYLTVRSEPDPRFVFQFGGEPECSPVVFQIQGSSIRQPVFSCKFSADRSNRSRSLPSDFNTNNRGWMRTYSGERDRTGRERKGWMFIVYDLSGSAVAAASMITPFVPSPGSDRVSRSNPGAWLILRPNGVSISSWKPWGRLEAWRERGPVDGLGYKFELITDNGLTSGIPIAEGTISMKKGGDFCIDNSRNDSALSLVLANRGFVMGSSVEGEGKVSKPVVQVGVRHVTCMADAALFVALSAAVDLSMDSCCLFSRKLRKEFSHDEQEAFA